MTNINQRNNQIKAAFLLKISADKIGPALLFCMRYLGISISWKVNKLHTVNVKEVDVGRFAGDA